jgi:hypothetical protein
VKEAGEEAGNRRADSPLDSGQTSDVMPTPVKLSDVVLQFAPAEPIDTLGTHGSAELPKRGGDAGAVARQRQLLDAARRDQSALGQVAPRYCEPSWDDVSLEDPIPEAWTQRANVTVEPRPGTGVDGTSRGTLKRRGRPPGGRGQSVDQAVRKSGAANASTVGPAGSEAVHARKVNLAAIRQFVAAAMDDGFANVADIEERLVLGALESHEIIRLAKLLSSHGIALVLDESDVETGMTSSRKVSQDALPEDVVKVVAWFVACRRASGI